MRRALALCVLLLSSGCDQIAGFVAGEAGTFDQPPVVSDLDAGASLDSDGRALLDLPARDTDAAARDTTDDGNVDCQTGDVNSDGVTDFEDLAFARACFSSSQPQCAGADVDLSGRVDNADLGEIQRRIHSCIGSPCSGTFTIETIYAGDMVLCRIPDPYTQCDAATKICRPTAGWTLCGATQFLQRGGNKTAASRGAWLGSCARGASGTVSAPSNAACGTCAHVNQNPGITVGKRCDSTPVLSTQLNIGVAASPTCGAIGPSGIAYWTTRAAADQLTAAVCCR